MERKIREEKAASEVAGVDSNPNESSLVKSARAGDQRAFGHLVRNHQKRLFRFILGLTGSFDQAEDVVQEAFVRAYAALDRFETERDFYPWLATIARNLALNQMQRDRKQESLDRIQEQGFDRAGDAPDPLDNLLSSENQKRFYGALKELPVQYREVFVLRHFEEMSYQDIAAKLKIAPGTVDSRLYRARQMLAEALKEFL
jgi:RNA polymerase sigma-70 factor (ECF subfamily)